MYKTKTLCTHTKKGDGDKSERTLNFWKSILLANLFARKETCIFSSHWSSGTSFVLNRAILVVL